MTTQTPIRRRYRTPLNIAPLSAASGPTAHHPFAEVADVLLQVVALVWMLLCEAARVLGWVVLALLCLCGVWAVLLWLVLIGWLWAWSWSLAPALTWR